VHEGLKEFCKSKNLFEYLKLLVQLRTQHLQRAMFVDLHAVFPNNPKKLCGRILFPASFHSLRAKRIQTFKRENGTMGRFLFRYFTASLLLICIYIPA